MLGFAPISGQAISGSPFRLAIVAASIAATVSFTFGASALGASAVAISATARVTFGGVGTWSKLNVISASVPFTFGVTANLQVAGRAYPITALAESFIVRADRISFTATALPDSYTLRGGKHS